MTPGMPIALVPIRKDRNEMNVRLDELLERLKWDFYDWCGYLSVDEIASNQKLVSYVEKFERLLAAKISGCSQ